MAEEREFAEEEHEEDSPTEDANGDSAVRRPEAWSRQSQVSLPSQKGKALQSMKTLADEMLYISEKLNASALYINKLLEVLLLTPEEYTELSEAGVVDKPIVQTERRQSSNPDLAQLMQLAQGSDMQAIAQTLLSRLQSDE